MTETDAKIHDQPKDKLALMAVKSFALYEEMYKVVDFLNKTLKEKRIMFGLTKDKEKGKMVISIYEV